MINFNPDKPAEVKITSDAAGDLAIPAKASAPVVRRRDSQYDQLIDSMMPQPRTDLACLLSPLQPKVWMVGNWADIEQGWKDVRHGVVLTFDGARELIAERIKELGLNPVLVYEYTKAHSTTEESIVFGRMTFEQQMARFK